MSLGKHIGVVPFGRRFGSHGLQSGAKRETEEKPKTRFSTVPMENQAQQDAVRLNASSDTQTHAMFQRELELSRLLLLHPMAWKMTELEHLSSEEQAYLLGYKRACQQLMEKAPDVGRDILTLFAQRERRSAADRKDVRAAIADIRERMEKVLVYLLEDTHPLATVVERIQEEEAVSPEQVAYLKGVLFLHGHLDQSMPPTWLEQLMQRFQGDSTRNTFSYKDQEWTKQEKRLIETLFDLSHLTHDDRETEDLHLALGGRSLQDALAGHHVRVEQWSLNPDTKDFDATAVLNGSDTLKVRFRQEMTSSSSSARIVTDILMAVNDNHVTYRRFMTKRGQVEQESLYVNGKPIRSSQKQIKLFADTYNQVSEQLSHVRMKGHFHQFLKREHEQFHRDDPVFNRKRHSH